MPRRTYRFTVEVDVEPGHPAYLDPEWAADAAASTLPNTYGLTAFYGNVEPVDATDTTTESEGLTNSYRFAVTFEIDARHHAFDDPGWVADAVHGALTNEYGIETVYAEPLLLDSV